MKYNYIVFDMDGTLLNTLDDLRDSVNFALRQKGYPERTLDEIRRFVGNGVALLVHRAVPEGTSQADEEECLVLAHEEGHIFLNHIAHAPVLGNDVQEEFEANEFARYVTAPPKTHKIKMWIKRHKEATFVLAFAIIVAIVAGTMMLQSRVESSHWTDYYITETGTKYHRENCIHIKGKDSVKKMTKQQLESGAYKPCGVCLPNE